MPERLLLERKLKKYLPSIFFITCLAIYGILANILRSGPDFNDETEKLVGAIMISDGSKLYKDMFAHHGPLSYIVSHFFYWISHSRDISIYRFIPILFSVLSIASIAISPAIKKLSYRLLAASLFALNLAMMQAIYGLMLGMYQIYAGHLIVCTIALLILPIISGEKVPRFFAFIGGLCIGFIFFAGYSFVVLCALLVLICFIGAFTKSKNQSSYKITLYNVILGGAVSIIIVGIYLYIYGDIKGYGVYHFYFNQFVYAKFSNYTPLNILHLIPPIIGYFTLYDPPSSWLSYAISSSVSIFAFFLAFFLYKKEEHSLKKTCSYFLILLIAIIFANPRAGDDFQMNTLVIVTIGFFPLITYYILSNTKSWKSTFPIIVIFTTLLLFISFIIAQFSVLTYLYDTSPKKYYKLRGPLKKSESDAFKLLRTIVTPDEKIQQFPYSLNFYIQMDRMPISGNYYYLPWQDAYFKDPILGYKINVCRDLELKLPKIIHYSETKIWNYKTSSYLGCIPTLLKEKYIRTSLIESTWIRADVISSHNQLLKTAIIPTGFDASWIDKKLINLLEN